MPGISELLIKVEAWGQPGDAVYLDDTHLTGPPPVTMTPTPSATSMPRDTPLPGETKTGMPTTTTTTTATETPATPVDDISSALRNPGFESLGDDGAPAAWHKYGGALSTDNRARSDSHAARLASDTESTKWLHQSVTVIGGDWYAFDVWVVSESPATKSVFLRISWYTSPDTSGEAIDTTDSTESLVVPAAEWRFLTTGAVQTPFEARSARLRIMLAPVSAVQTSILIDDTAFNSAATPITPMEQPPDTAPGTEPPPPPAPVAGIGRSAAVVDARQLDGTSSAAARSLVINEVLYDTATGPDGEGEWVELYNPTSADIAVGGWSIADGGGADVLGAATVSAHGFLVVAASDSFDASYTESGGARVILNGRIGNGLGNDGDRLSLINPSGAVIDGISWGGDTSVLSPGIEDVPAGHSIERRDAGIDTDRAADFVDNAAPSPGRAIDSAAPDSSSGSAPHPGRSVEIIAAHETSLGWLPWALVGISSAALVAVSCWRIGPMVAGRLRHQS